MALKLALGCVAAGYTAVRRSCCDCDNCYLLWSRYGYTNIAATGVAGPLTLYAGNAPPPPPTPATWPGFFAQSMTVPNLSQGGFCDDTIIQETGMPSVNRWFFNFTDPVKLWAGPWPAGAFPGPSMSAGISYNCFGGVPSRSIGIAVGYVVVGDVSSQFSESSFSDWTWTTIMNGTLTGRSATKTFSNGSVATWTWVPSDASGRISISGVISHTHNDLRDGAPPVTALTIPGVPYDYLGIIRGTVTIS